MSEGTVDRRFLLGALGGAAGVAALAKIAQAGPLNPPAGPIAPTGKTVQEIYDKIARTDVGFAEPRIPVQSLPGSATAQYVISQPGSYYLTGNIQGVAGKVCIEIAADDVILDLSGYQLQGTAGALQAIKATGTRTGIAVRNGTVSNWPNTSIFFSGSTYCQVEDMLFQDCNAYAGGLANTVTLNNDGVVRRCGVVRCLGSLVYVTSRGLMEDCYNVGGDGGLFFATSDAVVRRNIFHTNNAGLLIQGRGIVHDNVAKSVSAFRVEGDSVLSRNSIDSPAGGTGIFLAGSRAQCSENSVSNATTGILAGADFPNWRDHLIEKNVVQNCQTGILLNPGIAGCFVAGNRAKNCTTAFSIPSGNSFGPIVNIAGVGAITAVANANHPWANFIF